jgi:cyanate permease
MSTIGVNFHNVVLPVLIENELGSLIESPLGMYSMSWSPSSMVDPLVTVHGHDSLHRHFRSDVEWSVDMEAEFFVHSLS